MKRFIMCMFVCLATSTCIADDVLYFQLRQLETDVDTFQFRYSMYWKAYGYYIDPTMYEGHTLPTIPHLHPSQRENKGMIQLHIDVLERQRAILVRELRVLQTRAPYYRMLNRNRWGR